MKEALWDDLAHGKIVLASPEHGDALKESEQAHASGKAKFVDWETAKQNLRDGKA